MIIQLRVPDALYEKYAARNPQNPRAEMEKALDAHQDLVPGMPRVVVENPELKRLSELTDGATDPEKLIQWIEKSGAVDVAGVEVPLSLGQRQRLASMASFMHQPLEDYVKKTVGALLVRELGG